MMVFMVTQCGYGVDIALCSNVIDSTPNGIKGYPVVQRRQRRLPWKWHDGSPCGVTALTVPPVAMVSMVLPIEHERPPTVFTIPHGNSIDGAPHSQWHQ